MSLATTTLIAALLVSTLIACGDDDAGRSTIPASGGGEVNAPAFASASDATTADVGASTPTGASTGGDAPASGDASPGGSIPSSGAGGAGMNGRGEHDIAGAAGAAGAAGGGGSGSTEAVAPVGTAGAEPDCNSVTGQPIVTVAADGSGDHDSVEAALEAVGSGNSTPTQIRIKPGTYAERFTLETPMVTLCGEAGRAADTVIVGSGEGTSTGYTILITASDVSVENLTIQNTVTEGQAPALMTKSQRTQFRNCRILGYQDTLYAHTGTQYYRNCYIQGRVDYIFGGATAVYEDCEMHSVVGGTAICAPSTKPEVPFGLVFLGGKATASSEIGTGSQNLARSWTKEGATHYIGTELGAHIKPTGWGSMKSENKVSEARFGEYGSTGPGANPDARTSEVTVMTAADAAEFTIQNIFGAWTPSFSR